MYYRGFIQPTDIRKAVAGSDALVLLDVEYTGETESRCSLYYDLSKGDTLAVPDEVPAHALMDAPERVKICCQRHQRRL